MRTAALLSLIALLAGPPATAATYRWLDASGGQHYSQIPPKDRPYETLPAAAVAPPPASPAGSAAKPSDAEEFLRRSAEADAKKREQATTDRAARAAIAAQCQTAQERLRFLDEHPPNRLVRREAGGETRRVDADQWNRERDEAGATIAARCR